MVLRVLDTSGRPGELLVPVLELIEARLWVRQHVSDVAHADVVTHNVLGQLVCLQEYSPGLDWRPMREDCRGVEVFRD
jgi:hypothetical protein